MWEQSASVQSRLHFCIIIAEYSILTQNEIIGESYWQEKNLPHKFVLLKQRATINNKSIFFKKIGVLTGLKWACEITIISGYVLTNSFWVKQSMQLRETETYISTFFIHVLFCLSIHAFFVDFVLLFSFHHKMTTITKFIFFGKENGNWTWKAWKWTW